MVVRHVVVVLAALAVLLPAIAARADAFVYWSVNPGAGGGMIERAPLTGGNPTFLLSNLFGATGIAVDSNFIYWANGPLEIGRANLDGTSPNPSFIVGARLGTNTSLAVDSTHGFIYWVDQVDGTIGRAPLSGGTPNNSLVDTFGGKATGVAVDSAGGHIYWSVSSSPGNGLIGQANLDGSSPNFTLLSGLFGAQGIALDSNFLYWANGPLQIGRANLNGTSPNPSFIVGARVGTPTTAPAGTPTGLAVDSTSVYWGDHSDFTIGRAPVTGGAVNNFFISSFDDPTGVAVDGLLGASPGPQPPPAIGALAAAVQRLGLPHGIERSLLAKLDAAKQALDAGDRETGCGILNAYINEAEAQSGHKLDVAAAAGLIGDATAMRQSLHCGAG
jgi:hypothetical protein